MNEPVLHEPAKDGAAVMRSRVPVITCVAAILAILAACSPQPPGASGGPAGAASAGGAELRDVVLEQLLAQQARVWNIGYPILSGGRELCPGQVRANFGFQAWTRWDIGGQYRIASMDVYGLDDRLRVVHVLPGSPAAEAGLRANDLIEGIGSYKISSGKTASAAMQQILERKVVAGQPLAFHLRRGGERLTIEMVPRPQCDYALILTDSDQINAFFDVRKIYVTYGLTLFVADDAELAAVISHVLGHAMLAHVGEKSLTEELVERLEELRVASLDPEQRDRLQAAGITPEARPFTLEQEIQADRVALELMSRAGYSLEAVGAVWRRVADAKNGAVLLRDFHPVTPERLEAIDDLVSLPPAVVTAAARPDRTPAATP